MVGLRHGSGKPLSRLSARQEGSPPWPHGMGTLLRRWATQSVLLKSTTLASALLRPVLFTEATGQLVASWCFACRVSRAWRGRGHWAYGQQKLTVERTPVKSKHHQPVLLISVSLCFGKAKRINSPHVLFMPSLQSLATTMTLVKPTLNSFYWYEIPITLLSKTDYECLTFRQLWKPLWGTVFLSSSASEQERNSGQSDKLLKSLKVSQTISQIWTTSYGTTYNEYS